MINDMTTLATIQNDYKSLVNQYPWLTIHLDDDQYSFDYTKADSFNQVDSVLGTVSELMHRLDSLKINDETTNSSRTNSMLNVLYDASVYYHNNEDTIYDYFNE